MRILDYIILQREIVALRKIVNERISEGWIPLGGAQPISTSSSIPEFSQTMVKYGE